MLHAGQLALSPTAQPVAPPAPVIPPVPCAPPLPVTIATQAVVPLSAKPSLHCTAHAPLMHTATPSVGGAGHESQPEEPHPMIGSSGMHDTIIGQHFSP